MIVERPDLERMLADLRARCHDPSAGLFGPDTTLWEVARERVILAGGGRAALLQLAHPYVATAVKQHSRVERDLSGRFRRTFHHVHAMMFGDLERALGSARRVFGMHAATHGRLEEAHGALPAGHPYHANDEHALLWVHATLVDTSVRIFERCVRPLTPYERERYYADLRTFARLFGISDRVMPPDWASFERWFGGVLDSDVLTVGDAGRRLGRLLLTPPAAGTGWAMRSYEAFTASLMPPRLRAAFGLRYGRGDRALARATALALPAAVRLAPARLRFFPAYHQGLARVRGAAAELRPLSPARAARPGAA